MAWQDIFNGVGQRLASPFQSDVPQEYDTDPEQDGWELGGSVVEEASPVTLRGGFKVKLLEAQDFRTGFFRANEWSSVGSFEVPPGVLKRIPEGLPYRMFIKGVHRVAGLNVAQAPRTITAIPGMVRSTQALPALPTLFHPEILVWTAPAPGTVFTRQAVTAVDYGARSVTYTEPANTTAVEIHYVFDIGEWRFRVARAVGVSDTVAITVANGSFSAVHTTDQNNAETTHRWPQLVTLVPRQSIVFEVRTSVEVDFGLRSQHMLIIPTLLAQIDVNDPVALAEMAEVSLRG